MTRNVYLFWTTHLRGWCRWRYRCGTPPWVLSRCLDAQLRGPAGAEAYIASGSWDAPRGRWGSWEYGSIEDALWQGITAAERVLRGDGVWE